MQKKIVLALIFLIFLPIFAQASTKEQAQDAVVKERKSPAKTKKQEQPKISFDVKPLEQDFGALAYNEGSKGVYTIKKTGAGSINWTITASEGWTLLDKNKLSGVLTDDSLSLKVQISSLKEAIAEGNVKAKNLSQMQITLEANNKIAIYQKILPFGMHRETLKIESNAGNKNIFLRFRLVAGAAEPKIEVEPLRIDLGAIAPDQTITKRVKVTNKGKNTLKWKISVQKVAEASSHSKKGRYISFLNEETAGTGGYLPPQNLRDVLEMSGKWSEYGGYPYSSLPTQTLKYRFDGTGISLFFIKQTDSGSVEAYVNDTIENTHECVAEIKELTECLLAEGLPYGTHTLTIIAKGEQVFIEGVRVYGNEIMKGNTGWISIIPDSGTTNKETDYVAFVVNTKQLRPGYYGENILFDSNGGQPVVELSMEVLDKDAQKALDIYRYISFFDYFYTSNPQQDSEKINSLGYTKQGIAFRLFAPGSPGTKPFLRWYHPVKKVHFLSHEALGEVMTKKGYRLEGAIGNIATSRLTNTRELYRWFNREMGSYFYTTDTRGEESPRRGYMFDGIAGYVRF